jgi:hypothetical protein
MTRMHDAMPRLSPTPTQGRGPNGTLPMFNACQKFGHRIVLSLAATLGVGAVQAQQFAPMPRGPIARLVKTGGDESGLPPYALADQAGAIQRYVEPVPGIDLEAYVNQIVTVRHDTGETLLASQLELPSQSLLPMIDEGFTKVAGLKGGRTANDGKRSDHQVQQAQYIDNDDTTVELIEDGATAATGGVVVPEGAVPAGAIYPDGTPVMYPGQPMASSMAMPGPPMGAAPGYYDPMLSPYPDAYGMTPQYGGYPGDFAGYQSMGFVQPFGQAPGQPPRARPRIYGELEINFIRAHIMEETLGKLSEKYEFSPRFILGFSNVGNLNGRVRYWTYGRGTNGLDPEDSVHIDLDVWDIEATHRFGGTGSQVELAAGVRFAKLEIHDADLDASGTDLVGITAAADGWTPLFSCSQGCLGWNYGGRLSILAGDWSGDNELVDELMRDDNVVVHELYAGIGFTRCCRNVDLNARLGFEMQNWHSDVLSEEDASLGFVGPGVEIGAQF